MKNQRWPRNMFILVSLVCLAAFIFLSVDSVKQLDARTPKLTDQVIQGKKTWQSKNCINCHTILGNGAYYAPDLTKTAQKRDKDWLKSFLQNPAEIRPGTAMAGVKLTEQEAENMIALLNWVSGVDTNGWPPEPVMSLNSESMDSGKNIFVSDGCAGCHAINGEGGTAGPDLSDISDRRDAEWLKQFITNPQNVKKDAKMPSSDLSGDELNALVDYLVTLK